jgi:hypothetical protein
VPTILTNILTKPSTPKYFNKAALPLRHAFGSLWFGVMLGAQARV